MPFPRLVVFDLDGTLVDSEQDLAAAVNATLAFIDRPPLPVPLIRSYIGDGVLMLVRRALGDPEGTLTDTALFSETVAFFLQFYAEHKLDTTRAYPLVIQGLETLRSTYPEALMAVLTNKPLRPSEQICEGLGLRSFFFEIVGGDSFALKKPDPVGLYHLIGRASELSRRPVLSSETVLIGDSAVDIATAKAAAVHSLACSYGLTSPETLRALQPDDIAESPADWIRCCESLRFRDPLSR